MVRNARIYTGDRIRPPASAVATKEGQIIAIG